MGGGGLLGVVYGILRVFPLLWRVPERKASGIIKKELQRFEKEFANASVGKR